LDFCSSDHYYFIGILILIFAFESNNSCAMTSFGSHRLSKHAVLLRSRMMQGAALEIV